MWGQTQYSSILGSSQATSGKLWKNLPKGTTNFFLSMIRITKQIRLNGSFSQQWTSRKVKLSPFIFKTSTRRKACTITAWSPLCFQQNRTDSKGIRNGSEIASTSHTSETEKLLLGPMLILTRSTRRKQNANTGRFPPLPSAIPSTMITTAFSFPISPPIPTPNCATSSINSPRNSKTATLRA